MGDLAHSFTHREVATEVLRNLIGLYAEQLHNLHQQPPRDPHTLEQIQHECGHLQQLMSTLPSCDEAASRQLLSRYSPQVKVMVLARQRQALG